MKRWIVLGVSLAAGWQAAIAPPAAAQTPQPYCTDVGPCDDGLFCNGKESCAGSHCVAGADPCPGRACDEEQNLCLPGMAPRMEGGWVTVGPQPELVLLANSYRRPVVVAAAHYASTDPPLVVRVRQIEADRLELYLQSPSNRRVWPRRVSYLVVEEGEWEVDGLRFEAQRFASTVTDSEASMVGQPQTFLQSYRNPVVIGQVMTDRDAGWSVFWAGADSHLRAPAWNALRSGKTVGADADTVRNEEILGFVAFEAGRGRIGAAELEAGVTAAAVAGMGDGAPYLHAFSKPFRQPPEVALATVAGLTDPDVGWAVVVAGGGSLEQAQAPGALRLAVDEDQLGDAERSHGAERVAYLAFDRPFSFQQSPLAEQLPNPPIRESDYYNCKVEPSVKNAACSAAVPAINSLITACERAVDLCAEQVSPVGDCATCLLPWPSWKTQPILAILACVPLCNASLLEFIGCRMSAQSELRGEVDLAVCTNCSGPDCADRYGIEVHAAGLRCNEAVFASAQCNVPGGEEGLPTALTLGHLNPDATLPDWCPNPKRWAVDVAHVLDISRDDSFPAKRECTPTHREGPPGGLLDVEADFDCGCSGPDCGDAPAFPLVADVACMPAGSWFRLKTTVTDACGGQPRERTVRVDHDSPPVTRFPIGLDARPGDRISVAVVEDTEDAPCFVEGDTDSTMPANPPGGLFSVAQIRCRDDAGAGGCGEVTLTGSVSGDGMSIRPNGVTVRLTVGSASETKTFTGALGNFATPGHAGQAFSVSLVDPVHISTTDGGRSRCTLDPPTSGVIPQGEAFEVADIHCRIDHVLPPPQPDMGPEEGPFTWIVDPTCDYVCESNPPAGGGTLVSCDPCTFCRDPVTNACTSPCFCESIDVPGGRCYLDCGPFTTSSPSLAVTAGAATSGRLRADDQLTVSAVAADANGLQGFVLAVDGEYHGHVTASGTTGSFSGMEIDTRGLAAGDHTLRVIALDDHASAPTPIFVDVPFEVDHGVDPCQGDSTAPSLTLVSPANGSTLSPGQVQIQVQADDAGSGVKHVRFWVDGQFLAQDASYPFAQPWTAAPGSHTIRAMVWDHCDNTRERQATVTVVDACAGLPAPTVEITNYQDGQWVDPALFQFQADAHDLSGTGIERVEFKVASNPYVAVDATPPYVSTGFFLLAERDEIVTARAFDGCGRVASDTITLHVNANASVCGIDGGPPWATVNTPAEGALLAAGPVTVRATAGDDGVLFAAMLEVDGALVPNSTILLPNPAALVWTWQATPGSHVIRVKVSDVCYKIGWSPPRRVIVQ